MNKNLSLIFPLVMVVGLLLSAFVIVTALQAAPSSLSQTAASGQAALAQTADRVAHGRELFVAKGCLVCHVNTRVSVLRQGIDMGNAPDLTSVKLTTDYLKKWLHDPTAVKPGTEMPNLNLSDDEIDTLAAFLVANKE